MDISLVCISDHVPAPIAYMASSGESLGKHGDRGAGFGRASFALQVGRRPYEKSGEEALCADGGVSEGLRVTLAVPRVFTLQSWPASLA